MKKFKAIVDLSVIPEGWDLEQFNRVIEETGLVIVDTHHYHGDDLGVKLIDDNLEIKTIEEYESDKI